MAPVEPNLSSSDTSLGVPVDASDSLTPDAVDVMEKGGPKNDNDSDNDNDGSGWDWDSDSDNPYNWSFGKKWAQVASIASSAILASVPPPPRCFSLPQLIWMCLLTITHR